MIKALRKVIKRQHYPLEVMLTCVRWSVAYPLSLRHIEEMMAERGVLVDHATVHRRSLKILPFLAKAFTTGSARWAKANARSHGAHCWEGPVLAMLAELRVAPGGSAPPIPL